MEVAMVKHRPNGKVFWFEIPESLEGCIYPGCHVACDTARGTRYGTVVGANLNDTDIKTVMIASGAIFPLRMITDVARTFPMASIQIPKYMSNTKPREEKIAKRFLEFYHTGRFDTDIIIDQDHMLVDGYSAFLVAETLKLDYLPVIQIKRSKKTATKRPVYELASQKEEELF